MQELGRTTDNREPIITKHECIRPTIDFFKQQCGNKNPELGFTFSTFKSTFKHIFHIQHGQV
jgi:hypothetical protein